MRVPGRRGQNAGILDIGRLLAGLTQAMAYGGWSDAIHLDAIRPSIRITPLGDVQVSPRFFEQIIKPFGHTTSEKIVDTAVSEYATNFEGHVPAGAIDGKLDEGFLLAWKDEHTLPPGELREVVDEIEATAASSSRKRCSQFTDPN